ncbi:MAG: UbiD family decarboxylase [Cenarchaeum sp. SB0662_bin_33]|nr:UbiD family decarboxylase [Cenarchaeum sp. SB0662_bin_33]
MSDDIREYLDDIDRMGLLHRIKRSVSVQYEIAALTAQTKKALLFENIDGHDDCRLVTNIVGDRQMFAAALGVGKTQIHHRMISSIGATAPPDVGGSGHFMENTYKSIDTLPIVTHFEKESGPFITSSIVFASNPETGRQNSSVHRMMPIDGRHLSIRMVEGRHLHRCYMNAKEHGEDLRVAIAVGVHPAILIAGAYQAEWGAEEMGIANVIAGGTLRMSPLEWSGLHVPEKTEIVMQGRILQDVMHEEWMVEMLQTYDYKREQPVFEVESLHTRDSPIYHDILSGYAEHRLLMGMPVESKINGALQDTVATSASLSNGGCNWLHAIVGIKKKSERDAPEIIEKTFSAHRSLKYVIVVDDDIDINDAEAVEYALATRFQADRDIIIKQNVRGSSLDPSSDQENLKTAKMGIDATRPLDKRPEGFELARIPNIKNIRLSEYIR